MRKLLLLMLSAMMLAAGCQVPPPGHPAAGTPPLAAPPQTQPVTPPPQSNPPASPLPPSQIEGLTRDEYDGIEITAAVLERMAILSGAAFRIRVVVSNNGDQTVSYTHGSGSYTTPQALFLHSNGLQTVIPRDHLGPVTMDFATKEIKPGESLEFSMYAMAVLPGEDFDTHTFELWIEAQQYIADMDWHSLHEKYPGLIAAQPGSYSIEAYFLYTIADENDPFKAFSGPTGYAVNELAVGIS
ncbi:MAG: hypothetical protein FWH00_01285 [Oscillospiraceae bacterium]|nr:hypothetical protein [Oscillospiraceae bacterium]